MNSEGASDSRARGIAIERRTQDRQHSGLAQPLAQPYLLLLDSQWDAGCRNGAELWRRLKTDGFGGSPRVVSKWTTRRRRAECVTEGQLRKVPSTRTIVWMMTMARDHLTKADSVTVAAIEAGAPLLTEARRLVERLRRREYKSLLLRKTILSCMITLSIFGFCRVIYRNTDTPQTICFL